MNLLSPHNGAHTGGTGGTPMFQTSLTVSTRQSSRRKRLDGKLAVEESVGDWSTYHVRANVFDLLLLVEEGQQSSRPSIDAKNDISHTSLAAAAHDRVYINSYCNHGLSRKAPSFTFITKISYQSSDKTLAESKLFFFLIYTQSWFFFLCMHVMPCLYSFLSDNIPQWFQCHLFRSCCNYSNWLA